MNRIAFKLGIVALVFAGGMGGCMQMEHVTTLYPDGSGKLVMTIGRQKSMISIMEQLGGAPVEAVDVFEDITDPVKLDANARGIVAWSKPKKEEDGDWIRWTTTGYFQDISKVKLYVTMGALGQPKERMLAFSGKMERMEDGHTLIVKNDVGLVLKQLFESAEAERAKTLLAQAKLLFDGMKIRMGVTVPGKVTKAKGFMESKGRTASVNVTLDTITELVNKPGSDVAKKIRAFAEAGEGRVSWTGNDVDEAEITAFKAELEAAKKAWKKRLKKAKKLAAEKKEKSDF